MRRSITLSIVIFSRIFLSGFALLCWVYYGQSSLYLIDPAVMGPPAIYLASDDASGVNGQRIIAVEWQKEHKAMD